MLLLNPVLTVEIGRPGSHEHCGWHVLTSQILGLLCGVARPPVFLLWGAKAQSFFARALPLGAAPRVLTTRHPSRDFQRRFMAAPDSHFLATADLVDWWSIDSRAGRVV